MPCRGWRTTPGGRAVGTDHHKNVRRIAAKQARAQKQARRAIRDAEFPCAVIALVMIGAPLAGIAFAIKELLG